MLKGYQADADFGDRFTGNIHEERGRNVIVSRGQAVRITDDQQYKNLGTIADAAQLGGMLKTNDWNQLHVIAKGNTLMHIVNGHLMSVFIDDDPTMSAAQGVIALQIEGTGKVSFRNLWLKTLP